MVSQSLLSPRHSLGWNLCLGGESPEGDLMLDGALRKDALTHCTCQQQEVWRQVPADVKPFYHWFNIPADPTPGSLDNPLEMMKVLCKPEDFVVLKLDIDNQPVEMQFIAQIQADKALSRLIDEMFFEHHIFIEPLAECCFHSKESNGLMSDSAKIFLGLRHAGIRMHYWV